MTQKQFYKSRVWLRARAAYIASRVAIDGGLCETCRDALGFIVHHKIWLDDDNCNDPEIALDPENFRYDCLICHNKEIDPTKPVPGRARYGPDGDVIATGDY